MASIFKRGKTYAVSVSIPENGKYKKKSRSGFKTKAEANAWAVEMESSKAKGFVSFDKDQLLSEYFKEWYETYKNDSSRATQVWYKTIHGYIAELLPNVTLSELKRPQFQKFMNILGSRYALETSKKVYNIIHQSIKSAMYDEIIFKDPLLGIALTGKDGKNKDLKFLEEPQMKALADYITNIELSQRTDSEMIILLALNTGARYEELAGLTWQDIRPGLIDINKAWDQISHEIKETKTNSSNRVISVPNLVTDQLFAWKDHSKSTEFVFGSPRPITTAAANKRLKAILETIKSPKIITFHGLRHTHASWLLSHSVDVQYVSERLGHKNVSMTLKVYTHLLDNLRQSEENKSLSLLESL